MLPYQQHLCCVAWGSLCPHYAYIQDNFVQWRKKRRRKKHHLILSIWYTLIQSVLHFEIKSFKFLLWSVTGHILRLYPLNESIMLIVVISYHACTERYVLIVCWDLPRVPWEVYSQQSIVTCVQRVKGRMHFKWLFLKLFFFLPPTEFNFKCFHSYIRNKEWKEEWISNGCSWCLNHLTENVWIICYNKGQQIIPVLFLVIYP